MHYKNLSKNNKFCTFPWIGTFISPSGHMNACCMQTNFTKKTLNDISIDHTRNSTEWVQLRKDLINGIEHPSCEKCWFAERNNSGSTRTSYALSNQFNMHDIEINKNGTLNETNKITYWDIRSSNKCNMKCINCNPSFSSSLNTEAIDRLVSIINETESKNYDVDPGVQKINDIFYAENTFPTSTPVNFYEQFPLGIRKNELSKLSSIIELDNTTKSSIIDRVEKNIDNLTGFYFAGGEPLMNDIHWKILDILIKYEKYDLPINYNTNFSLLTYKGKNILDYWKKFKYLKVGVSIDAIGKRAKYLRYGTNWKKIEKNIDILLTEFSNIDLEISSTVSILSLGGFKSLYDWAKNRKVRLVSSNFLEHPEWLAIVLLSDELKDKFYNELKDIISDKIEYHLYKQISTDDLYKNRSQLKKYINVLDKLRNNSIFESCPELSKFYKGINE